MKVPAIQLALILNFAVTAIHGGVCTIDNKDSSDNDVPCTVDDDNCCFTGTKSEILEWCDTHEGEERCCVYNGVVAEEACARFWESVMMVATVCKGSCWGQSACGGDHARFRPNSCRGDYACENALPYAPSYTLVESNSCNGDYACYGIGYDCLSPIYIQSGACNGEYACAYIAGEDEDGPSGDVDIHSDSCNGSEACYQIGYSASSVVVGSGACNGEEACKDVGYHAESVEIGSDACNADEACFECASTVDYAGDDLLAIDEDFCSI